ncbi:Olfactory receptor 1B1 [Camelus dromedarius]|uniref:Olfactory receptor n=2 Tax=Camelus TaxID=9836 RepID=A0A5N4EAU1_CAMDR|nr:olfactory receptor 1B1 [Camelus bactrianus]XP_010982696.1 olfactory receptor 1B1 [Camelus dromedarius]KAB1280404.1 Olfactory receptor 1B1 [Camelus dromedarius]
MGCASNASHSPVFLLLGFSRARVPHRVLFLMFLAIYLTTIMGNVTLVLLISWDSRLHSPMYYLLRGLSVVDMGLSTVTLPQLLAHLVTNDLALPAARCLAQFFFFYAFGVTDTLVISVMALDRYVAICDPLHYHSVMNRQLCARLLVLSWVVSVLHTMLHVGLLLPLHWAEDAEGNVKLPHFFCDHRPLLRASCSDIHPNELAIFLEGGFLMLGPCALIVLSYVRIGATILRLPSASGRRRAVSTCGSHLTIVGFLYGTIIWVYFQPPSQNSQDQDMVAAVMYTAITPLANPFVYSLRNKDVKGALHRLFGGGRVDSG